jgi:hypothetical protein
MILLWVVGWAMLFGMQQMMLEEFYDLAHQASRS